MIRDIVNKEVANLSNCEKEPIHVPGSIQPHGLLIALDKELVIRYCSANVDRFFGKAPKDVIGLSLERLCQGNTFSDFKKFVKDGHFDDVSPFVFQIEDDFFNTSVHVSGAMLLLELEPFPDGSLPATQLYYQTRKFVKNIEQAASLQYLLEDIAVDIRELTGYDRVMIYRFDEQYNGEVCAESKADYLEPFLGLHYPHTDIPPQARALYLKNLLRMITDVNYEPVPIYTDADNDTDYQSLDLSLSVLRSVSPIHIEYLKNMGVTATLTVSLIKDGKLWGLVACHHYSGPKFIPHYTRISVLLQGHFLTSQIRVQEVAEEHREKLTIESKLHELLDVIDTLDVVGHHFCGLNLISEVINAGGAAMVIHDQVYTNGNTPPQEFIRSLASWVKDTKKDKVYYTEHLFGVFGEDFYPQAAGFLSVPLGKKGSNFVFWFRPELSTVVNWAGNPDKAVVIDPATEKLSPRKSFALWQQTIRHQSVKWSKAEVVAAVRIGSVFQSHLYTEYLEEQELRYRVLSEKLKKANDELANINWITAHDLKEPLRKINVFTSRIMDIKADNLTDDARYALTRIKGATDRMKHLLDDILAYTMLENKTQVFLTESLNVIIDQVGDELMEELQEQNVVLVRDELPSVKIVPFQIRLLFKNLISNAIKFADFTKSQPSIEVRYAQVDGGDVEESLAGKLYHRIAVIDNGIGFNPDFKKRIFDVFYRVHDAEKYIGTGIGLAICKKIISLHNGFITADGAEGVGATFFIFLPTNEN